MWIVVAIVFFVGWVLLKLVWGLASMSVNLALGAAAVALGFHVVNKLMTRRQPADRRDETRI